MPPVDPANNRGGSGSPVSRSTWVGGGVVALVFLLGAVILFSSFGTSTGARATLRTYEVLSDSSIRVQLDVARPTGATALCSVRAYDQDGATVADSLVEIPPGQDTSTVTSQDLTTDGAAVAVEVGDCSTRDPAP